MTDIDDKAHIDDLNQELREVWDALRGAYALLSIYTGRHAEGSAVAAEAPDLEDLTWTMELLSEKYEQPL